MHVLGIFGLSLASTAGQLSQECSFLESVLEDLL